MHTVKLDSNLDASWYQIAATSDNNEGSGCGRGTYYPQQVERP